MHIGVVGESGWKDDDGLGNDVLARMSSIVRVVVPATTKLCENVDWALYRWKWLLYYDEPGGTRRGIFSNTWFDSIPQF